MKTRLLFCKEEQFLPPSWVEQFEKYVAYSNYSNLSDWKYSPAQARYGHLFKQGQGNLWPFFQCKEASSLGFGLTLFVKDLFSQKSHFPFLFLLQTIPFSIFPWSQITQFLTDEGRENKVKSYCYFRIFKTSYKQVTPQHRQLSLFWPLK